MSPPSVNRSAAREYDTETIFRRAEVSRPDGGPSGGRKTHRAY
jgi:hypothetical protein